uniref:Ig-like domain-containing protein n=1 Tax=Hucho hucho TaxID=62062 RepID=A0A4W5NB10_9TELE
MFIKCVFTDVTQCNDVQYQTQVREVHPGDPVTLYCVFSNQDINMFWYKQMVGQKPQNIVTMTKYDMPVWHKDFNHSRFNVEKAGESHPGVIYTPGNRSDKCEKSPETPSPTQSCVYSLSKNNLGPSDAGTYYCAVATCGEILLGNGTNLNIEKATDPVIIALGVTSAVCVIVILILICTRHTRPVCEHCKVGASQQIGHDNSTRETCNADTLNYAALNFSERNTKGGRKKRETPQESVYSDVRCSDWE